MKRETGEEGRTREGGYRRDREGEDQEMTLGEQVKVVTGWGKPERLQAVPIKPCDGIFTRS